MIVCFLGRRAHDELKAVLMIARSYWVVSSDLRKDFS